MGDSGLNERQLQAVHHVRGPLVVFAGAGSGKTRVITQRVAHLVGECDVRPWRILAVTFTNKAAGEMRQRLASLLPEGAEDLWVGTFHAVCARLLRRYHELAGIRRDFVIYDDTDQKAMVTRVLRDLAIDDKRFAPKAVAGAINRAKQEGVGPDRYEPADPFERVVHDVYRAYHSRMLDCGALDFGDLIFQLVDSMKKSPELLGELQSRFSYVMVDEFQDTNHVQSEFVRLLCQQHENLCVVGDDDQSIYRWRGADRRNILDFRQHFPAAHIIKLEQNYRSTKRILRVANAVVGHNVDREPKSLWTDNDEGTPITVVCCEDERDEADVVIKAMLMLVEAGYQRSDIALLYRVHAQSRVFEEALRFANVPYRVIGGLRFYDRAEVKDLLAYLRVIHNPDDDVSLLRVINTPTRGIGKTTVGRLLDAAAREGKSVWTVLGMLDDDPAHNAGARRKLEAFRGLVEGLTADAAAGSGPSDLAQNVLSETGYIDTLKAEDSAEADARLENLREVIGSMIEFERDAESPTLEAFLELVTLQTDVDRMEDDDMVTLMTVHAAKGLEFPIVMVGGLEEEMFPGRGGGVGDDPEELEEERRLAYVAFTRAEERLMLTHAQVRRIYGEVKFRQPSRFLTEMPLGDLNQIAKRQAPARQQRSVGGYSADPYSGTARSTRGSRSGQPAWQSNQRQPAPAAERVDGDSYVDTSEGSDLGGGSTELWEGRRVRHKKFGVGQVQSIGDGIPPRVTVHFAGWGTKQIVARFLEPA